MHIVKIPASEFQDFWSINCMLKDLYYNFEAPLDVFNCELLFVIAELNFTREQWFSLC